MNAFYTPIYRNPLIVLAKIQRLGIGGPNALRFAVMSGEDFGSETNDLSNTLSSILNV